MKKIHVNVTNEMKENDFTYISIMLKIHNFA